MLEARSGWRTRRRPGWRSLETRKGKGDGAVPKGKLITIVEICKRIAERHAVKARCSLTTGIFIMTAANATEEAAREERPLSVPHWRTLKADGFLNEKYRGGVAA
jgi:hypothetical protein